MSLVRILIATTEGPAEIRRLVREEDCDLQSVVCLDGRTAQALPVSLDYDAFVRKPTGIVERAVGHPVFRLDVSRPVTSGRSWQLGALLAHLLLEEGRLAMRGEPAGIVALVSGEVTTDLHVGAVEHVREKLLRAAPELVRAQTEGADVVVVLPEANAAEADPSLLAGTTIIAAGDVATACRSLEIRPLGERLPAASEPRRKRVALVAAIGALTAAVAGAVAAGLAPPAAEQHAAKEAPAASIQQPAVAEPVSAGPVPPDPDAVPPRPGPTRRSLQDHLDGW